MTNRTNTTAQAPPTEATAELIKNVRSAIADPGRYVPRGYEDRDGERIYDTIPHWGACAVIAGFLPTHDAQVRADERRKAVEELLAIADEASERASKVVFRDEFERGQASGLRAAVAAIREALAATQPAGVQS